MTTPTNAPESANKPCDVCSRPIGNRVFTICDDCWPAHGPAASTPAAPQPERCDDCLSTGHVTAQPCAVCKGTCGYFLHMPARCGELYGCLVAGHIQTDHHAYAPAPQPETEIPMGEFTPYVFDDGEPEPEGMTFDEWWRTEGLALDTHLAIRIARAAWTAAKGGR